MRWFVNLLIILTIGVAALWWLLLFTDYFELVGGLLGLGGVFAWVAFAGNIILDERKATMRESFDRVFLQSRWATILLPLLAVTLFLTFPVSMGSLVLQPVGNPAHSTMQIYRLDNNGAVVLPPLIDRIIEPSAVTKVPLNVGWFDQRSFRIKLGGLPAANASLAWFERKEIRVPDHFEQRTIVVIRPHPGDSSRAAALNATLTVRINEREYTLPNYRGQAVWVGNGEDVPIDQRIQLAWRSALPTIGIADRLGIDTAFTRWLPPTSIAPLHLLHEGDRVEVELAFNGTEVRRTKEFQVGAFAPGHRIQSVFLARQESNP
ncbi:MAG: hypothetical protein AAF529_21335 [Pseudomonadota bacterium]